MLNSLKFLILALTLILSIGSRAADAVATLYPPVIQGDTLAVAADKAGVKFVTGRFMGTKDFNPGVGEDSKTSVGGFDTYVTRFEADGTYAWTKTFGGTLNDSPRSIILGGKTLYVGGVFLSQDAGFGAAGSFAALGNRDGYIWAMDAKTGSPMPDFGVGGLQKFGGSGVDNITALAISGKFIVATGNFDSLDAGIGGAGMAAAAMFGSCFGFMIDAKTGLANTKFGTDGIVTFGGLDVEDATGIAASSSTIYFCGAFESLDFAFDGVALMAPIGVRSGYVLAVNAKDGTLNTKFNTIGAIKFGGTLNDRISRVALSGSALYIAGTFISTDAGLNAKGTFATRGKDDVFVMALSAKDGKVNTKFGINGLTQFGGNQDESLGGLLVSKFVYITGSYESDNINLGNSAVATQLGKDDIYVLALNIKDGRVGTKSTFGFASFGGKENDNSNGIVLGKKTVFVSGNFDSLNAGYGAFGPYNFTDFGGLLIPFDILTGKLPVVKAKDAVVPAKVPAPAQVDPVF